LYVSLPETRNITVTRRAIILCVVDVGALVDGQLLPNGNSR